MFFYNYSQFYHPCLSLLSSGILLSKNLYIIPYLYCWQYLCINITLFEGIYPPTPLITVALVMVLPWRSILIPARVRVYIFVSLLQCPSTPTNESHQTRGAHQYCTVTTPNTWCTSVLYCNQYYYTVVYISIFIHNIICHGTSLKKFLGHVRTRTCVGGLSQQTCYLLSTIIHLQKGCIKQRAKQHCLFPFALMLILTSWHHELFFPQLLYE